MDSKIKKVNINPGCISCGACQAVCPEVFEMKGVAYVKDSIDLNSYSDKIDEAVHMCPVEVIEVIRGEE